MLSKKKYSVTEPSYRCLFAKFLIFAVFAAMFTARIHVDTIGENSQRLFSSSNGLYADWFLYCKEVLALVISVICILYFIAEKIFPDKPCRNDPIMKKTAAMPLILLGVYLLTAVLSAIFSRNKDVVLWGVCTEYEGVIAVFSYCVLFFAGYNYFSGEKARRYYRVGYFILIIVTVILSFFEYLIMPLLELPFMKYFIAPYEYRQAAESLEFTNGFRETVLMFFNSNYMGCFCTMFFPVSVYYITAAKKTVKKIICGIISGACFIVVFMSNSSAALYVVIAEIIFMIIFMIIKKIISIKKLIIIISAFAVMAGCVSVVSGNKFISNIIKSITNQRRYDESAREFKIDDFQIEGNTIIFSGNGSEYRIIAPVENGEQLRISGGGNAKLTLESTGGNELNVHDSSNEFDFDVMIKDGIIYLDLGYISTIDFAVTSDGVKLIVQNAQLLDSIPHSRFSNTSLREFYGFATGRGYIWINSVPILKECLFLGKGAGNFPFCFNQNELVGMLNTHGTYRIIVDKPHNRYLQIAVTCGIPALIAILILLVYFVISGMKVLFKTKPDSLKTENDVLFLIFQFVGLCGFMISGLANDSCVAVSPFFWFGFGIAFYQVYELKKKTQFNETHE